MIREELIGLTEFSCSLGLGSLGILELLAHTPMQLEDYVEVFCTGVLFTDFALSGM